MVATSDMMRILRGETRENEWMYVMNGVRSNRRRTRKTKEVKIAKAN